MTFKHKINWDPFREWGGGALKYLDDSDSISQRFFSRVKEKFLYNSNSQNRLFARLNTRTFYGDSLVPKEQDEVFNGTALLPRAIKLKANRVPVETS